MFLFQKRQSSDIDELRQPATINTRELESLSPAAYNVSVEKPPFKTSRKRTRNMWAEFLTKQRDQPAYGSRVKTGKTMLQAKAKVLETYPTLAIQDDGNLDRAFQVVAHGANSVRAEMIDLNAMLVVMQDNVTALTHTAIERFFDWMPPFMLYLEWYMLLEEELLIKAVETKADPLRGKLKTSGRMLSRGTIQRHLHDLMQLQDIFTPYLPAGQKLPEVVEMCDLLTTHIAEYWSLLTAELPDLIRKHFSKSEVDKLRLKIIKHVVDHVGYKDFIAIFTRWMRPSELLEWKTNVLLPCDYKFFSYSTWERQMDQSHYCVAAQFGQFFENENAETARMNEQSRLDFERAQDARLKMERSRDEIDFDIDDYDDYDEDESINRVSSEKGSVLIQNEADHNARKTSNNQGVFQEGSHHSAKESNYSDEVISGSAERIESNNSDGEDYDGRYEAKMSCNSD